MRSRNITRIPALLMVIAFTFGQAADVYAFQTDEDISQTDGYYIGEPVSYNGEPPVYDGEVSAEPLDTWDESCDFEEDDSFMEEKIPSLDSGRYSVGKISMKDLHALYKNIRTYSRLYETAPVISGAGYHPSVLTEEAYGNAGDLINYYRGVAGLGDVNLSDAANLEASYGAMLLAMVNTLTHTPPKPNNGISEEDYKRGYDATSSSNLSFSYGYGLSQVLDVAISGQICDEDPGNIRVLGHRRWLLDPRLLSMGVGSANNGSSYFTDVKVFGNAVDTGSVSDYDLISWPASGNNLSDRFPKDTPWSITLNPLKYQSPSRAGTKVTIKNVLTGNEWKFDSSTGTSASGSSAYFNVDNNGYAVSNCIIFRPPYDRISEYSGIYLVTVTGIRDRSGNDASFSYPVIFEKFSNASSAPDRTYVTEYPEDFGCAGGYEAGDIRYVYSCPGSPDNINVTFSDDCSLAEGDTVKLYGADNKLIGEFRGSELAGKKVFVKGSVLLARLISSSGGSGGFSITDVERAIPITGIVIEPKTLNLVKGESDTLAVSFLPEETTSTPEVTFRSSNETVASVDGNGTVTAVGAGGAVITASADGHKATCTVNVVPSVESAELSEDHITLFKGCTDTLEYTYLPVNAKVRNIEVSSYPAGIIEATASDGMISISAQNSGETELRANIDGIEKKCTVTVTDRVVLHFLDEDGHTESRPAVYGQKMAFLDAVVMPDTGLEFAGWFTCPDARGDKVTSDTVLTNQFELFAFWNPRPEYPILTAEAAEYPVYTGKAVNPRIIVRDGAGILNEKTDYTLKYRNNVNAYTLSEGDAGFDKDKAPAAVVEGKGLYSGNRTVYFRIKPYELTEDEVTVTGGWYRCDKDAKKIIPTAACGRTKLVHGRDFTVEFNDTQPNAYIECGHYSVTITGIGNYEGTFTADSVINIYDDSEIIDLSKASIGKIADRDYEGGEQVKLGADDLVVTASSGGGKRTLAEDEYTVSYRNNILPGTATVTVSGVRGKSRGSRTAYFKIKGQSLKKAEISVDDVTFDGTEKRPEVKVASGGSILAEGRDYDVRYINNTHAGKGMVTITGKGGYTDSAKKTFTIFPVDMSSDHNISLRISGNSYKLSELESADIFARFTKGATAPVTAVIYNGVALSEGKDYTLKFSNNTAVTDGVTKKLPEISIKGKKDFKGAIIKQYRIIPASLDNARILTADVAASTKPGGYISVPLVYDTNGKLLTAGKDYEIRSYKAFDPNDGTVRFLDRNSVVGPGMLIEAKLSGKGTYTGTRVTDYTVRPKALMNIKIPPITKPYRGIPVMLSADDFADDKGAGIVSAGTGKNTVFLEYGEDFEIIEGTYANNGRPGNASVMIRGLGDYAGTATVKFKITGKKIGPQL